MQDQEVEFSGVWFTGSEIKPGEAGYYPSNHLPGGEEDDDHPTFAISDEPTDEDIEKLRQVMNDFEWVSEIKLTFPNGLPFVDFYRLQRDLKDALDEVDVEHSEWIG